MYTPMHRYELWQTTLNTISLVISLVTVTKTKKFHSAHTSPYNSLNHKQKCVYTEKVSSKMFTMNLCFPKQICFSNLSTPVLTTQKKRVDKKMRLPRLHFFFPPCKRTSLRFLFFPPLRSTIRAFIDWFWSRGWLIDKGAICTRTAPLFWIFISLFQHPRTRLVRKIGSQNQSIAVYCKAVFCGVFF